MTLLPYGCFGLCNDLKRYLKTHLLAVFDDCRDPAFGEGGLVPEPSPANFAYGCLLLRAPMLNTKSSENFPSPYLPPSIPPATRGTLNNYVTLRVHRSDILCSLISGG